MVLIERAPRSLSSGLNYAVENAEVERTMRRFSCLLFLVLLIQSKEIFGWETDNFSCVSANIEDSSKALNEETNRRFKAAIDMVNKESPEAKRSSLFKKKAGGNCNQEKLTNALSNVLASSWMGNLETWANKASNVDRCVPSPSDNIFKSFRNIDAPMAKLCGLRPVIRIGKTRTGIDKLSHFMKEGYEYWQSERDGGSLDQILQQGIEEEEGMFGWTTTGTKSYGDMCANYFGFLFWKSIFDGPRPYLKCENGVWFQMRDVDWNEYVNPCFDESINCNEWGGRPDKLMKETADAFGKAKLSGVKGLDQTSCPIRYGDCLEIGQILADNLKVLDTVVHPSCLAVIRDVDKGSRTPRHVKELEQ